MKLIKVGNMWINPEYIACIRDRGGDEEVSQPAYLEVTMGAEDYNSFTDVIIPLVHEFYGEDRETLLRWLNHGVTEVW